MTRNLKALGLAFVAMLIMGAMAASAAQAAPPEFTIEEAGVVGHATAEQELGSPTEYFEAFGGKSECEVSHFRNITLIGGGLHSAEVTATPEYTAPCKASGLNNDVKTNECDYEFTATETDELDETGDSYWAHVALRCDPGEEIEETITLFGSSICTITIGESENTNLTKVTIENMTNATPKDDVTVSGTVEGITATIHRGSALCPGEGESETRHDAKYIISPTAPLTVTGENELGQAAGITVSDSGE